jgi:molybdate transport system substrate-binding protein
MMRGAVWLAGLFVAVVNVTAAPYPPYPPHLPSLPYEPAQASARSLTIAAASDLQSVFPEIVSRFEHESGWKVTLTFGSSGNFFTQIENGAPFDLYFSADVDYPKRLDAEHLAEPGSLYEYAKGKIVIWARSDSGVDPRKGLSVLLDPTVKKIAVANPEHAPYGRAAVAALQHEQLYDKVRPKLVVGENISQAAQFVQSGNAEAGILALSLALTPALKQAGSYYEIPGRFYPPIEQGAIILKSSANKDVAQRFLTSMKRSDIKALMERFGFEAR